MEAAAARVVADRAPWCQRLTAAGLHLPVEPAAPFVLVRHARASQIRVALARRGFAVRSAENFTGLGPEYLRFAVRAPDVVDDLSRALESVLEEGAVTEAATLDRIISQLEGGLSTTAGAELGLGWAGLRRYGETVARALVCVDVTSDVVEAAVAGGYGLVVAHHPLLLRGVDTVAASTPKGALIHRLIRGDVRSTPPTRTPTVRAQGCPTPLPTHWVCVTPPCGTHSHRVGQMGGHGADRFRGPGTGRVVRRGCR